MSAPHYDPYPRQYGPPQRWQTPPPPPVEPPPNFAAIISVVSGVLGLLLPAVVGPVALIAGFVGQYQALRGGDFCGSRSSASCSARPGPWAPS
jgi:hypothetical protein